MQLDLTPTLSTPYTIIPVPSNLIPSSPSPPKQHILWVGCSDSLVSETDSLDVDRQEIFVHRNLGNLLSNADLSSQSSIEWAVELLKVDHIVVCGHYDCALLKAPMSGLYKTLPPGEKSLGARHLAEVSVLAEIAWLKEQANVKAAIEERGVQIHAFVFDKVEGRCVQLIEGEEGKS